MALAFNRLGRFAEAEQIYAQIAASNAPPALRAGAHQNWGSAAYAIAMGNGASEAAGSAASLAHWESAATLFREAGELSGLASSLASCAALMQRAPNPELLPKIQQTHAELLLVLGNLGRALDPVCAICQDAVGTPTDLSLIHI